MLTPLQRAHDRRQRRKCLIHLIPLVLYLLVRRVRNWLAVVLSSELQKIEKNWLSKRQNLSLVKIDYLLCDSSAEFCRFKSSIFCWCTWFLRLINVMYSAAFFNICARLACIKSKRKKLLFLCFDAKTRNSPGQSATLRPNPFFDFLFFVRLDDIDRWNFYLLKSKCQSKWNCH